MSPRHVKLSHPTNTDLVRNPMIGGSKGANIAQVTPDELEEFAGANTFEGDLENDTNPQGGIDKAEVRDRRRGPPQGDRDSGPRKTPLQGKKTHSGRNTTLLVAGIALGILFNPVTGPETRRWLKDMLSGGGDDFGGDYSSHGGTNPT